MIAPQNNFDTPPLPPTPSYAAAPPISRGTRRFLWIFSVFLIVVTGSAFTFKLIEFIYTFSIDRPASFAIMPVLVYLLVAAGFACLFCWAYLSGYFRNVEQAKYRMLEMQDQFDLQETR